MRTVDGYILEIHRIPGSRSSPKRRGKRVAFLQHGLLDTSAGWILMGPDQGLGYLLADQGYDVWLGNARGNRYSRNHSTYDPNGTADDRRHFWNFSWHEIGVIDVPTQIDYVLNVTGEKQIHYIGHSQGTTAFFVMASELPEYNDKILSMNALAPAAYMKHLRSYAMWGMAYMLKTAPAFVLNWLGVNAFKPNSKVNKLLGEYMCQDSAPTQIMCKQTLFLIGGYDSKQLNSTMLPVIIGHTLSGASIKQMQHYIQSMFSGYFRQFDYGRRGNWKKYNQPFPPDYKLDLIRAPVTLHYSLNDWLSAPDDVQKLIGELGNNYDDFVISDPNFTHFDFMWAIDARRLVYKKVLTVMKRFE